MATHNWKLCEQFLYISFWQEWTTGARYVKFGMEINRKQSYKLRLKYCS
jgi:hypothetical protein